MKLVSVIKTFLLWANEGNENSGNHGHAGREGEVGGSSSTPVTPALSAGVDGEVPAKLYRSSDGTALESLHEASGGFSSIVDGVYLGESTSDVSGYGTNVHTFKPKITKVLDVNGDAELDTLKSEATAWAKSKFDAHLQDVKDKGIALEAPLMYDAISKTSALRSYLESKGYDALRYRNATKDDHHDQIIVFRDKNLQPEVDNG